MGTGRIKSAAWILCIITVAATPCAAVVINFDTDPGGNPIVAPTLFASTVPLRDTYASIGVNFLGPTTLNGGAILSGGGFGVQPRSAPNFLAFSRSTTAFMQNGGQPRDPETITFDTPITSVSIYGSGGSQSATFQMEAFDSGGGLITSTSGSNTSGQYVQLSIPSPASPISRIVLTEIGGDTAWVYDDLEFTFVPEPSVAATALLGAGLILRRRRH
jgi:hypothetical protein